MKQRENIAYLRGAQAAIEADPGRRYYTVRPWHRYVEACAAAFGLLGSFLLAARGEHAAWGWVAFLASNVGWIAFGWIRCHWFLVLQQVGFTATSLLGIWRWLL